MGRTGNGSNIGRGWLSTKNQVNTHSCVVWGGVNTHQCVVWVNAYMLYGVCAIFNGSYRQRIKP